MKISVRLTIYSVMLTVATVILCCTILLVTTANNQIVNTIQSGETELRMLNNVFAAEVDAVADDKLSDTAKHSLVLFVFREYTNASVSGSHYVLTNTQETMFNDSPIDPRPLLPELQKNAEQVLKKGGAIGDASAMWPSVIAEFDGRRYLVVGHWDHSFENMYFEHEVYLVRDITDVYHGITELGIRFGLIALGTVLISAVTMILVIRRVLRPLGGLQKSAAALADGQYSNRIEVKGKDEIAELGARFNQMAQAIETHIEALEDTAEQRKLLLSALTHELKTPMTAIIGYSESLMRVRLSKEQQEEAICYIHSECRRIERLSQKIIKLVTLHGGEPPQTIRQQAKVLFDAVKMTIGTIAQKENITLIFKAEGLPEFNMDIDMMASVLINLFDNARKAGAKHVTITAEETILRVQDDGMGIPTEELEKITQPFYMVDKSHSQSIGGSGLGLALCEMIVKAHHAKLDIQSELGKGTIVSIHF